MKIGHFSTDLAQIFARLLTFDTDHNSNFKSNMFDIFVSVSLLFITQKWKIGYFFTDLAQIFIRLQTFDTDYKTNLNMPLWINRFLIIFIFHCCLLSIGVRISDILNKKNVWCHFILDSIALPICIRQCKNSTQNYGLNIHPKQFEKVSKEAWFDGIIHLWRQLVKYFARCEQSLKIRWYDFNHFICSLRIILVISL